MSSHSTILGNSSHSYTEMLLGMGLTTNLKTLFTLNHVITGPPTLPRELERRIFEACAWNYPETSSKLMLVAPRVRDWYGFVRCCAIVLIVNPGLDRFYLKLSFLTVTLGIPVKIRPSKESRKLNCLWQILIASNLDFMPNTSRTSGWALSTRMLFNAF